MEKINVNTPFGEAMDYILRTLTDGYENECACISFCSTRKGDILNINVSIFNTATQNKILTKGHAHCTWTRQFYPTAVCMDINTLFEELEKGVKPSPRRNFEEIIKELAEKPCIKKDFKLKSTMKDMQVFHRATFSVDTFGSFTIDHMGYFSVLCNDSNYTNFTAFSPEQHTAISEACAEIAANCQAEHGKEEA